MDDVNLWIGVILGVLSILATTVAGARWTVRALSRQMRSISQEVAEEVVAKALPPIVTRIDKLESGSNGRMDKLESGLNGRMDKLDARMDGLDSRMDKLEGRMDQLDAKVDHLAEVVDLRLKPLEQDMALIKQHLLGIPAA